MRIKLEQSGSKRRHAYDYDLVRISWGEMKRGLIGVIQQEGIWEGWERFNVRRAQQLLY